MHPISHFNYPGCEMKVHEPAILKSHFNNLFPSVCTVSTSSSSLPEAVSTRTDDDIELEELEKQEKDLLEQIKEYKSKNKENTRVYVLFC